MLSLTISSDGAGPGPTMDIPTVRIQDVTTIYQMSLLLTAFLPISPNRRFRATQVLRLCAVLVIRSRLGGGYRYYQVTMRTLLMGTKRMRPKKRFAKFGLQKLSIGGHLWHETYGFRYLD